jgi:hypothetical protein
LAISIDQDVSRVRKTAQRLALSMSVAVARGDVLEPFGMHAIPSTAFISADGRIVAVAKGSRRQAFFEEHASELMRSRP